MDTPSFEAVRRDRGGADRSRPAAPQRHQIRRPAGAEHARQRGHLYLARAARRDRGARPRAVRTRANFRRPDADHDVRPARALDRRPRRDAPRARCRPRCTRRWPPTSCATSPSTAAPGSWSWSRPRRSPSGSRFWTHLPKPPRVLVVGGSLQEAAARGAELHRADPSVFEATWRKIRSQPAGDPALHSGTTGDPKGVVLTHRNVIYQSVTLEATVDHARSHALAGVPAARAHRRADARHLQPDLPGRARDHLPRPGPAARRAGQRCGRCRSSGCRESGRRWSPASRPSSPRPTRRCARRSRTRARSPAGLPSCARAEQRDPRRTGRPVPGGRLAGAAAAAGPARAGQHAVGGQRRGADPGRGAALSRRHRGRRPRGLGDDRDDRHGDDQHPRPFPYGDGRPGQPGHGAEARRGRRDLRTRAAGLRRLSAPGRRGRRRSSTTRAGSRPGTSAFSTRTATSRSPTARKN